MGFQAVNSEFPIIGALQPPEPTWLAPAKPSRFHTAPSDADKAERKCRDETLARLSGLGVPARYIEDARHRAYLNGSSLVEELIASGVLDERAYYRRLAKDLNLEFIEHIDPQSLIVPEDSKRQAVRAVRMIRCLGAKGLTYTLAAPSQKQLAVASQALRHTPGLAASIRLTTPSEFERAFTARLSEGDVRHAVNALALEHPDFSAKKVLTPWQGFMCGVAITLLPILAWFCFVPFMFAAHLLITLIFAACVLLRLSAAQYAKPLEDHPIAAPQGPYPIYSVLVALHKEAGIVPQLCACLNKLNWPASRLEVLFICEESDLPTIEALKTAPQSAAFRTVTVPDFGPQTKPRALTYALPMTSGEFVVVYDAEDRPHPDQLMEAYSRFQREPMRMACLQAPLVITNKAQNMLTRMFAFEYLALFSGMLPFLAANQRILPLGGTSNHFRRSVLMEAGKWDPYNVTEDADLGTRLFRLGYRVGMLSKPTLEDAPPSLYQWLPQRTRWFKGWMQTWLLHMRKPSAFLVQAGFKNFLTFQVLTFGMVLSAMVYPMMLIEMAVQIVSIARNSAYGLSHYGLAIFAVDFANIILGHMSFVLLGSRASSNWRALTGLRVLATLPFYWTLLSLAAWRAVWQLARKPHHWEKTAHFPTPGL